MIKPQADIVFVKRDEPEEKEGSIVLPQQAQKKATRCRVVAAGPGRWSKDGKRRMPMAVQVDDIVHVNTWIGEKVEHEGEELFALHEDEIEAIEA